MNKKYKKAKRLTIAKWEGILGSLVEATNKSGVRCDYCIAHQNQPCAGCPATDVCMSRLHTDASNSIYNARSAVTNLLEAIHDIKEEV